MANLHYPVAAPETNSAARQSRSSGVKAKLGARPRSAAPKSPGVMSDALPPRALIHCDAAADDAVQRLLKAAASLGMDVSCAPALNSKSDGAGGSPFELVIVHLADGASDARALSRYRHVYRGSKLVVLGSDDTASNHESLLAEGVSGLIPCRYSGDAMAAALRLIRTGERFRPQAAPGDDAALRKPAFNDVGMRDFGLTKVEREVLALAAQGLTNLEISLRRGGVEGTVKVHMNHIFNKLNVRSRCEAIAVYLQTHNVDPEELRRAQSGDMDMKWLLSTMTHEHHLKGTVLFRRGQQGDRIYYLQNGIVRLKEIEVDMRPRDLFGEIGVFAPEHKRTCTAVCSTDVDLFSLSFDEVRRCYFLNPQFAFYVMYLITQRLMADRERFKDSIA